MDIYDLLRILPLASAAIWFVLAGLQVYRDRIHTWTETFFLLSCIFAGIVNLYRLHKIVRKASPALAARTRGFLIVFALVIVLGLGTNGALGALRSNVPPPFSTLALVIAAATIYTLYPGSTQRISEAVRRFQSRRYSIKASFLTFEDGTLIGSKARPAEAGMGQDLFGATLDVI